MSLLKKFIEENRHKEGAEKDEKVLYPLEQLEKELEEMKEEKKKAKEKWWIKRYAKK